MRYWPDRLSEDLLFECFQDCQGKPDEKCDQENRYRSQASKIFENLRLSWSLQRKRLQHSQPSPVEQASNNAQLPRAGLARDRLSKAAAGLCGLTLRQLGGHRASRQGGNSHSCGVVRSSASAQGWPLCELGRVSYASSPVRPDLSFPRMALTTRKS
jgi:hypothetical protein